MAFRFASSIAFKEAASRANPVLLEPMMALELETPERMAPALEIEIHAHRGRIERNESANGLCVIRAIVPPSKILSSVSSGLTDAPMEFVGYEPVRGDCSGDEGELGVTANKPLYPRSGDRSEAAPLDPGEGQISAMGRMARYVPLFLPI
jgi:translation elongation factor EF-G